MNAGIKNVNNLIFTFKVTMRTPLKPMILEAENVYLANDESLRFANFVAGKWITKHIIKSNEWVAVATLEQDEEIVIERTPYPTDVTCASCTYHVFVESSPLNKCCRLIEEKQLLRFLKDGEWLSGYDLYVFDDFGCNRFSPKKEEAHVNG